MKKLVLVWGGKESGNQRVVIPLEDVTQEVYDEQTKMFGSPKGRTEEFINLVEVM